MTDDYDFGYSNGYDAGLCKDKDTSFLLLAHRIEELKARIAELEAALKPFADAETVYDEYGILWISVPEDDLRAARTALEGK